MAEVLTLETPFQEFLDYVEVKDVIDALAGRISLSSQLPGGWGNSKELRPSVPEDTDPAFNKVMVNLQSHLQYIIIECIFQKKSKFCFSLLPPTTLITATIFPLDHTCTCAPYVAYMYIEF